MTNKFYLIKTYVSVVAILFAGLSIVHAQNVPELMYYKFDGSGSTTPNLGSAPVGAANATITGMTQGGAGQFSGALLGTGGVSTSNNVATGWSTNLSGPWTMSMWFSGVTNALSSNYLFGDAGGSTFRALTGSGVVAGAGNLEIRGTGMTDVFANGVFDAVGSPVVIHFVYNPTVPDIKVYINGVFNNAVAQTASMVLTGTGFLIGGYSSNNCLPSGGKMDEFRLYNRALTASEISSTWNNTLPLAPCTSPPTPGTSTASPSSGVCVGTNITLSLTGNSTGSGQTYQWQSSSFLAGPYTNIGSPNASQALVTPATGNLYYRCELNCSGNLTTSTPVLVTVNPPFPGGNYTINSAVATGGTNFQTFNAAKAALACGISGPVVFDVVAGSGPYNEQVSFNPVGNSSSINTITINGNGRTLTFAATVSTAPSTLELNGADNFVFNNLIVTGTGATYAFACHLWNQADNNTFNNCTFSVPANCTNTTQVPFSLSGSQTSATTAGVSGNNNLLSGCTMNSGYYNTCLVGNSAAPSTGNQVINCNIRDQYFYGSYNVYQNGAIISNNSIERPTRTTLSTFYGVYVSTSCTNMLIEKNRIRNPYAAALTNTGSAYGVYDFVAATLGNENKIYNNLISDFKCNGSVTGIYLSGAGYVKVYHNTISLDYTAATGTSTNYGIYNPSAAAGVDIRNNIITISQGGTGIKYGLYLSLAATVCNYNDLLVNGAGGTNNHGFFSVAYGTFAAFQAANGGAWNQQSVNVNPLYVNPNAGDYTPSNGLVNNIGTSVGVLTDINNNSRSASTPDPGAYEFSVGGLDASIAWFSPSSPTTSGLKTITVNIFNTQTTTINSIDLSYNAGSGPVTQSFTGLNIPGGTSQNLSFTTQYNLVSNVIMTATILAVNGGSDAVSGNNSITYSLCIGLSGTYTINSAVATGGTNFQTFTAAFAAIGCGIAGPVVFNVAAGSGPYNEQIEILALNTSAVNTITINGNGRTLTYAATLSTAPHTLSLNGADYITVNNLNIVGTGATYALPGHLWNGADNNTFSGCTFTVPANTTSTTCVPFSISGSATSPTTSGIAGSNNLITGCTMNSGYYNTVLYGNSVAPFNTNNQVINCNIRDFYFYGCYNVYCQGSIIRGNVVERTTRTTLSTAYCIYLSTGSINCLVEKNRVRRLFDAAPTNTSTAYCLYNGNSGTSGNENKFYNNLVSDISSAGSIYGVYVPLYNFVKIYHNTISLDHTAATTTSTTYGIYAYGTSTEIRNNNVSIRRGGTGTKYGLYIPTPAGVTSNNNNVFVNSSAGTNYFGYNGTSSYLTLAAWQAANPTFDQQSMSADPAYFNPVGGVYRPTAVALDNNGAALGITDDITGALRSPSAPDPGAYEFTVAAKDIGVFNIVNPAPTGCYTNAETIVVTVKNYGVNPIDFSVDPVNVFCAITGPVNTTVSAALTSGILAVGGTQNVSLSPTVNGTANGTYNINAYTTMATDGEPGNDAFPPIDIVVGTVAGTVSSSVTAACVTGSPVLTVEGTYGGAIQWKQSTVSAAGPWTNVGTNSTTYTPGTISQTTYYMQETVCNANTSASNVVTVDISSPVLTGTTPASRCGTGTVVLGATTSAATVNWYTASTGGTPIGTGTSFTTPTINTTTTFYAAASSGGFTGNVGWVTGTGFTSGVGTATYGLVFDALAPFTLNSVTIYGNAAANNTPGTVVMGLYNNTSGALLQSQTFNVVGHIQTTGTPFVMAMNWNILPGTNYRLAPVSFTGITGLMFQSSSGPLPVYPYTLGGVVSITNSTFGGALHPELYYYFYNWSVSTGCESARTAVTATVNSAPPINVVAADPAVCPGNSTNVSVNSLNDPSYTYTWTSNPAGFNASGTGPHNVSPTATTKYIVTASDNTVGPNAGCVAVDSVTVIAAAALIPGTVSTAQASYCVSGTPTILLTGSDGGATQWQSSTVSSAGPWTNVGTNSTTYNPGSVTQTTYYQAVTSCQTNSVTSNVLTVSVNSPQIAGTTPASRCGIGTLNLGATGAGGATINWYAAATGGSPLGSGNSFTTPSINNTTTYYAAAAQGGTNSPMNLMTTSAAGNGANGNLFDVNILNTVRIDSFSINAITAGTQVGIYYRVGTGVGFNTSNAGWTLIGSTTISTINPLQVSPYTGGFFTVIPLNVNLTLSPGLYSFALSTSTTVEYTNGTALGNTFVADANMEIKEGYGGSSAYPTFGFTNVPRVFNGRIYYTASLACESNRVPVVATVNPPPTLTVTPTQTTCSNVSKVLSVSSPNDPNYTYTWTPGNLTGASVTVNPSATTTYTVSAIDNTVGPNAGCTNEATVLVNVNPAPTAPTMTPTSALLCEDDTVKLKASGQVSTIATIGAQTSTTQTGMPFRAGNGTAMRTQYLYTAAELTAAGLTAGNWNEFRWTITTAIGAGSTMGNLTIRIGHTSATSLSGTFLTSPATVVYGPTNYVANANLGDLAFVFTSPFNWNGTSNVVIEICHDNPSPTGVSGQVASYTTSFVSVAYVGNVCGTATGGTTQSVRPVLRIYGTSGGPVTWSPLADLFEDVNLTTPYTGGLRDSVYSHPSVSRTYTATTTLGACIATSSVTVTVDVIPQVTITPAGPTSYCPGSTVTLNSSTDPSYTNYAWTPGGPSGSGATSFTVGGATNSTVIYRVTATGAGGCTSHQDIPVHVHDTVPPTITIIGNANLCSGQTTSDLQADIFGATGPAQTYAWSTTETTQLITVYTGGNYSLVTTDIHGCVTHNTQVITESAAPAAPIVTPPGPINLCSFDGGATYSSVTLSCTNYSTDLQWTTSETTPSILVDYADNFNVIYTDASGCFSVSNTVSTFANLASDAATSASSDAPFNSICLGNTVTLSVNGGFLGDGATWHWYEGSCNGTPRGTGTTVTLTPSTAGTHTYYVRAEGICNTTACASISVQVSSTPPPWGASITTFPASGCNGTSAVMSGPSVSGATFYNWSCSQGGVLFNGSAGPVQTATPSVNVTFVSPPPAGASGYSICVFAANGCGQSLTFCRFVRARVTQPSTISGSIIACANTNNTYSVGAVTGADTYTWTVTGSATINGGGTTLTTASSSVTVNFLPGWTTGTLTVYASLNCGYNSASRSLAISSTPAVPGIMNGPGYVCAGSSATFSVPAVNGAASYNWTTSVPGAVISPTSNSASILFPAVIPAGSTVCVTAVSSCGNASAQRCKSIANGIPNIPGNISGPLSGQCGQSGVSYSITPVPQATSYLWTATNGATVVGPNNLSAVSINFPSTFVTSTLSVVAQNTCGSSPPRTLVVNGTPAQPGAIGGNQSVCNGAVEPYTTGGSTGATGYNWVVPAGATILNTPPYTSSILVMWGPNGGNVTVSAGNDCGTSSLRSLAVAVTCREAQVSESSQATATLYPNPTAGTTTLIFESDKAGYYNVSVIDITGQLMQTEKVTSIEGMNMHELDLSTYAKGFYMIRLESEGEQKQMLRVTVE